MKADILPPFVIITGAFVVIGVGLSGFHKLMNNGKPCARAAQVRRTRLDAWDRLMWDRDHRITGSYNEQRDGFGLRH